jgi:hypothetical protein
MTGESAPKVKLLPTNNIDLAEAVDAVNANADANTRSG